MEMFAHGAGTRDTLSPHLIIELWMTTFTPPIRVIVTSDGLYHPRDNDSSYLTTMSPFAKRMTETYG